VTLPQSFDIISSIFSQKKVNVLIRLRDWVKEILNHVSVHLRELKAQ